MKKVISCLFIFVSLIFYFSGCNISTEEDEKTTPAPTPDPYITFEEVSQPYLDKYGTQEDFYTYDSEDYHTVDWWWWSKGFEVTFSDTPYNDTKGWCVDSEYTFPPI